MNAPVRKVKQRSNDADVVLKTLDDLFAIPEAERRHELIEGAIVPTKEATAPWHGRAQRRLSAFVDPFDRPPGDRIPGGWWIVTEVDVYFDAKNSLRPDLTGWQRKRVPKFPSETPVRIRPDWVCEILSTNRAHDLVKKKRVYHRYEVPHYWMIDPLHEMLQVYRWGPDGYIEVLVAARGEIVHAEPFELVPFPMGILFGDDLEDNEDDDDDAAHVATDEPSDSTE
jgi:Uma2 family endonuclease